MEPFISESEDAFELLEEARTVSEPIARGDLPHDFTLEQLFAAHTKAGRVLVHLTRKIERGDDYIDFDDYETLQYAHQSFRTLTNWLLRHDGLDDRERLLLELSEKARMVMWPVVAAVDIVYAEPDELSAATS